MAEEVDLHFQHPHISGVEHSLLQSLMPICEIVKITEHWNRNCSIPVSHLVALFMVTGHLHVLRDSVILEIKSCTFIAFIYLLIYLLTYPP